MIRQLRVYYIILMATLAAFGDCTGARGWGTKQATVERPTTEACWAMDRQADRQRNSGPEERQ